MRLFATLSLVSLLATSAIGQELKPIVNLSGNAQVSDAASYGIGYEIGQNMSVAGITTEDIKQADLLAGLFDALTGKPPGVDQEALSKAMEAFGKRIVERKMASDKKFFEENKKKDGVQVTKSGLQFQVIKAGNGATPTADSNVSVHYEGRLLNGSIFDSSIQRGQPASFGVGQVIPGWTEALLRMKVGDKWKLFIPPELAYGERGSPPVIGPNEPLVFEVELLEVKQ
jgi:FKBP-type peptidyl-prolyl cis-trans isomerase FklB